MDMSGNLPNYFSISSEDSALILVNVLDTALWYFLTRRPIKLTETRALVDRYLSLKHLLPKTRIANTLRLLLNVADESNDSLMLQQLLTESQELLTVIDVDTVGENTRVFYRQLGATTYEIQNRDSLLNALTKSVPEYNKLWNGYLSLQFGPDAFVTDARMERLYAKFWYPSGVDLSQYPRLGKVSLMVSLPAGEGMRNIFMEPIIVAQIRRLKAKFPDLDILLSYRTQGFFDVVEPPTPAQEAVLADSLWLRFHKLPAILLVEETPFWRLPAPDRRRVDEYTEFEGFGEKEILGRVTLMGRYIIIDQNRDILLVSNPTGVFSSHRVEKEVERKLDALFRRKM